MHTPESRQNYYFGNPPKIADNILVVKRDNRLPEYTKLLDDVQVFGNVWHGVTGIYKGKEISIVATQVGPSMVGDCVYALNRPESVCLYSGTCGSLDPEMNIGDFVVPQRSISGDGFSQMFGQPLFSDIEGDETLHSMVLDEFRGKKIHSHSGISFTTSSVLAEAQEKFWDLVPKEVNSIEMGGASFFTACQKSQKRGVAVFWVTDFPRGDKSFFDVETVADKQKKHLIYSSLPEMELGIVSSL